MSIQHPQTQLGLYVAFDKPLQELYERLGDVVLLPVAADGKPLAEAESFEATQKAAYLRQLSTNDVAVRCGTASGNVYAITFAELRSLQQFLAENELLRAAALINGPGGHSLFLRVEGFRPKTTTLPDCQWLGEGAGVVVRVRSPFTPSCRWQNPHKPLELAFSQIRWGEGEERFKPELFEFLYGKSESLDSRGRCTINYPYWAAGFADQSNVRFDPEDGNFYSFNKESDSWVEIAVEYVEHRLIAFLAENGKRPGNAVLRQCCNRRQLREFMGALKAVAATRISDTATNLRTFIRDCLEGHGGSDVTGEELYSAFRLYCSSRREPLLPEPRFQKHTPSLIANAYQIGRSNSIIRDGACRRGYHNLRLKLAVYAPATEVSQPAGTAGTAGTGKCTIRGT